MKLNGRYEPNDSAAVCMVGYVVCLFENNNHIVARFSFNANGIVLVSVCVCVCACVERMHGMYKVEL